MHPGKTRIVNLAGGEEGFDFLGFHLRMVKSRRYGKYFCQRWPSRAALARVRAAVKAITASRSRLKCPIQVLVRELNPVLRGWDNYFRWGNSTRQFSRIDSYVHERLALFDSKKHQKSGRRWGRVHTNAWLQSLGVYHLHGTIRYGC
jgi:RNA-directed DNA polymerase